MIDIELMTCNRMICYAIDKVYLSIPAPCGDQQQAVPRQICTGESVEFSLHDRTVKRRRRV